MQFQSHENLEGEWHLHGLHSMYHFELHQSRVSRVVECGCVESRALDWIFDEDDG